jgi:hypothetical protein
MTASQWLGLLLQASIMLTVIGLGLTATWHWKLRLPAP